MKGSQKCCLLIFVIFSTAVIYTAASQIYNVSADPQTHQYAGQCKAYLCWKYSMLAHIIYFFVSLSCTVISLQHYEDNYEDGDQRNEAVRQNENPQLEWKKNVLRFGFLLQQGLFVLIFGPSLFAQVIIASVYYGAINSCQLAADGNQMLIYSIVGFGIFSLIMTILFFAGFFSCIAYIYETRRYRRQLERAQEEMENDSELNEQYHPPIDELPNQIPNIFDYEYQGEVSEILEANRVDRRGSV